MRDGLRAKFDAADVVQDSLLQARAGIGGFNGTTEAEMRAWLKQIVLHNLISAGRRYTDTQSRCIGREQSLETIGTSFLIRQEDGIGSDAMLRQERREQVLAAFDQLPPRQQYVVKARQEDYKSYKQIAEQLNTTEAAARQLWSRALNQLRILLTTKEESLSGSKR